MTHLAPDELIDALDGALTPTRRAHLDTCDVCRREAASLRAMLSDVRTSDVPEPSPLFWDRLSARVHTAIHDEAPIPRTRWFHWPVLAPLTTLAALVLALISTMPGASEQDTMGASLVAAASGSDIWLTDAEWALVSEAVADLDVESARDAGLAAPPGAADMAVLHMTAGEQQELMRLLREELDTGS